MRLHSMQAEQVRYFVSELVREFYNTGRACKVDWRGPIVGSECKQAYFDTWSLGVLAFNLVSLECLPKNWWFEDVLPRDHKEEFSELWTGIARHALEMMPALAPLAGCLSRERKSRPSVKYLARKL